MRNQAKQANFGESLIEEGNNSSRIPQPVNNTQGQPSTNNNLSEQIHIDPHDYDLSAAGHPLCCIFTFVFKVAAFVIYFFFGFIFSLVTTFILVTILSAVDFWVVKNVTGRLLVGLRWWSDFDERGKEIWRFQSYDREHKANSVDAAFFWTSQLIGTVTWAAFLVLKVLSIDFFWGLLVFINFSLCGTNLYGYYKCRGQHNKKLQDLKAQGIATIAGRLFKVQMRLTIVRQETMNMILCIKLQYRNRIYRRSNPLLQLYKNLMIGHQRDNLIIPKVQPKITIQFVVNIESESHDPLLLLLLELSPWEDILNLPGSRRVCFRKSPAHISTTTQTHWDRWLFPHLLSCTKRLMAGWVAYLTSLSSLDYNLRIYYKDLSDRSQYPQSVMQLSSHK